jgi:AcrR family transcriptional regulator
MSSSRGRDTRTAILDSARELFETQGYFATGLEGVAKKAGVSRQAIYLHFSSKGELLRALHERVNEQDVAPAMARVWAAPDADQALDVWVEASADAIPKIMGIANALNTARQFDTDVETTWEAPKNSHYEECLRLAKWLRKEQRLRTDMTAADAADMLWNLTGIWAFESLVHDRGWSRKRWITWLQGTLRQLLLAPARP